VTYKWVLLCNAAVGVLGVGLAELQRGRSRFYYWSMIGSSVLLLLPILQYVFSRFALMTHNYNLYSAYMSVTLLPTIQLIVWGRWLAYALLFLGVLDLKNDRSEASLAGATLPAHPTVASDADAGPDESGRPET
jgi:hypothetical protein